MPHALGYAQDLAVPGHACGLVIAADKTTIPGGRSRPGVTRRAYRNFRAYPALKNGACARLLGQWLSSPARPSRASAGWAAVAGGGHPGRQGVGVSGWPLARAVARTGQLGVVSGVALDATLARRLQLGDPGGHLRRALAHFPVPAAAERIVASPAWTPG